MTRDEARSWFWQSSGLADATSTLNVTGVALGSEHTGLAQISGITTTREAALADAEAQR